MQIVICIFSDEEAFIHLILFPQPNILPHGSYDWLSNSLFDIVVEGAAMSDLN
jgi:hypothetical protein